MITLTEQDLKSLNDFFQEMPTKYGTQLINFFNQKIQEAAPAVESTPEKTEE